jgi:hypothetical protein
MLPEPLPMGILFKTYSKFQTRHLGQLLGLLTLGVVYQLTFFGIAPNALHPVFLTCRSLESIMSPIGMRFTQAKSPTSHSSPNTSGIFRTVRLRLSFVFVSSLTLQ